MPVRWPCSTIFGMLPPQKLKACFWDAWSWSWLVKILSSVYFSLQIYTNKKSPYWCDAPPWQYVVQPEITPISWALLISTNILYTDVSGRLAAIKNNIARPDLISSLECVKWTSPALQNKLKVKRIRSAIKMAKLILFYYYAGKPH